MYLFVLSECLSRLDHDIQLKLTSLKAGSISECCNARAIMRKELLAYKVSIYAVVITEGEKASCFF